MAETYSLQRRAGYYSEFVETRRGLCVLYLPEQDSSLARHSNHHKVHHLQRSGALAIHLSYNAHRSPSHPNNFFVVACSWQPSTLIHRHSPLNCGERLALNASRASRLSLLCGNDLHMERSKQRPVSGGSFIARKIACLLLERREDR